ncbi:MAG: hypothetical protein PF487_02790 [Bacteroidales bacterium]|jgi:hypothetical protein|nr:hypothetical protein [Bacteroidales bacterium]
MNKKIKNDCSIILNRKIYKKKFIKNNFSEVYDCILKYCDNDKLWLNKLFDFIFQVKTSPLCSQCKKPLKFKNKMSIGYGTYCSKKCASIGTREKVKQTNLAKYGVDYPMQNTKILNKVKQTNLDKYGVTSTLSNPETQKKIEQTNLEKYGVDNPFKSGDIRKKIKQTNLEKYDVDNYSKTDECKEKTKETNLEKYGVASPLVLSKNRDKLKEANLKKFGVEYPFQNSEIRDKSKITMIKTSGFENISLTPYYKYKILNNLNNKWSNILNLNVTDVQYVNGYFKLNNYCNKHKSFKIKYDDLYNRIHLGCTTICTKCNPISKQSKIKENEINEFLLSLDFEFKKNDRKILNGFEIDFYFPKSNMGIEFNGLYWHSNKFTEKKYHLNKTEECKNQGIQLLHIFEDEWIFKKEIVKSIIKSKLGVTNTKIFGRKTEIREIDNNKLIREFLNTNHMQGFVGSNIKIGLFYDDELVSLMTFGKKRIIMGNKKQINNEYEMLRFCNKLNTTVIGGASKILKHFVKKYKPKSILTFADRRYSEGNLYKQLGFDFIKNTKPNYFYFKKNEMIRYYRFNFRKDKLVREGYDKTKTEFQIMDERGYLRIFDSGNMKFIYK